MKLSTYPFALSNVEGLRVGFHPSAAGEEFLSSLRVNREGQVHAESSDQDLCAEVPRSKRKVKPFRAI